MNRIILLAIGFLFICSGIAQAQLLTVAPGTNLTIMNGTVFKVDDLILTPSADFIISNNTLTKSTTAIHFSPNPYISRVYQFTNTTDPFTGSVQINYNDGAELNGIPETQLTLNIHNGALWLPYTASTRDATNNYVLSNGVVTGLNELTLANSLSPLPLVWLSFTATRQNKTTLLKWSTAHEQNTRNFTVQHSSNGINWAGISTLPAAGGGSNYNYIHISPVTGTNYYRILQTDADSRSSYSDTKTLKFTTKDEPFIITRNPVTDNVLTVQINEVITLSFYTAGGKLLWQEQFKAGTKIIDVSRYAKGTYFLKANNVAQIVVIQ